MSMGIGFGLGLVSAAATAPYTQLGTFTVTEQTASALTNYQVPVAIPYKAGMASDFSNVQLRDADGAILPAWIKPDTLVLGVSAQFWTKLPALGVSETRVCSYGSGPSDTNNGAGVFTFFDDFEGTSRLDDALDATRWTAFSGNGGTGRSAWLDRWQIIDTGALSGGATGLAQGLAVDAGYFYLGKDNGADVDGTIYKYDRTTKALSTSFAGPPHCNSLSVNASGNIMACSAGNVGSGGTRTEIWEITPLGVRVALWTTADSRTNVAHFAAGQVISIGDNGTSMTTVEVLDLPGGGGVASLNRSYALVGATITPFRVQAVHYYGGIVSLMIDDGSAASAGGAFIRWKLNEAALTATLYEKWEHLPGGEREAAAYDGANDRWFYATHAGTINELKISPRKQAQLSCYSATGITNRWISNTPLVGNFAVMTRGTITGLYPAIVAVGTLDATERTQLRRSTSADQDLRLENAVANAVTSTVIAVGSDPGLISKDYELRRVGTSMSAFINGAQVASSSTGISTSDDMRPMLSAQTATNTTGNRITYEFVAARKIISTEPTVAVS